MVTVDEVWKGALPAGTGVVAGREQLHRQVTWSLVLRSRPPGLETSRGGELIILSMHTLAGLDAHLSLAGFLSRIADRAAAAVVQGNIDAEAVAQADGLGLPLLQLPGEVAPSVAHRDVLDFLTEKRSEWYRRRHSILHDLTTLAAGGSGLQAIAERMSQLTGNATAFQDETGRAVASFVPANLARMWDGDFTPVVSGASQSRSTVSGHPMGRSPASSDTGLEQVNAPIVVENQVAGMVLMVGPAEQLGDQAHAVLESGATAGAVQMARERAVLETVDRIQGGLINDLVDGGDVEAPARRARRMGYDIDGIHVAMAYSPSAVAGEPTRGRHEALIMLRKRLPLVLSVHDVVAPVHADEEALTLFYPLQTELGLPELKKLAERLRYALASTTRGQHLRVGVSQCQRGIDGFRASFREARRALAIGQALEPSGNITCFGDLGVYRLLFSLVGTQEMKDFYNDVLGKLSRHDQQKSSELVLTLEAYLYTGSAMQAAGRLHVHRNSLAYRLRRIREITGLDLDDPEIRLTLHLAFRVGEMLRAEART